MSSWLVAAGAGLAVVLGLEALYPLVRKRWVEGRLRFLYHLWTAAVATLAAFTFGGGVDRWPRVGLWVTAVAMVLSIVVLYTVFALSVLAKPRGPNRAPLAPRLVRDVVGWLVFVAAVLGVLTGLGITEWSTVVVSSTVLSAVVGLALQDVLKNVFAGLALQVEKDFATGDWLLLDGLPVQVLEMSWRTTKLRSNDGYEFYEPNANLSNQRIVLLGSGDRPLAWNFRVGLPYDVPPAKAKAALAAAAVTADGAVEFPRPGIFLESYGDSAITYRLRVWMQNPSAINPFIDAVNSRIWYELKRQRITIPFPIRTVELHQAADEEAARAAREVARSRARLDELPLFADLAPEQRDRLAQAARRLLFDHGEKLVREGEEGDSLFVVDRGRVVISKSGDALGTDTIDLASLSDGAFFGEMSLLTGEPRSATVTAEGPCEVLMLDRESVAPILAGDPEVAEILSQALAARVAATSKTLEDHRGHRRVVSGADQATFLRKIRALFRL